MNAPIEYDTNRASEAEIADHLLLCDANFVPPLSKRVDIKNYTRKIVGNAVRFEAWLDDKLIGLVAAYCNDTDKYVAYVSSVSVLREWNKNGIGAELMRQCINYAKKSGMRSISLEVEKSNISALKLYEKCGFVSDLRDTSFVALKLILKCGEEHEHQA